MKFRRNPHWHEEVRRSPEVRRVRHDAARDVAREAERIGKQVADSYRCEVDDDATRTRVAASADEINPASWIEFGTGVPTPTPAYAPLRKGADRAGLKTEGPRR